MSRGKYSYLQSQIEERNAEDEVTGLQDGTGRGATYRGSPAMESLVVGLTNESEITVLSLDPALIDASPYRDRLGLDDGSIESLRASIAIEGQRIPILVRRNPRQTGRYEVAYGHRRLRAIQLLNSGRKSRDEGYTSVQAFVREMSDEELARAQGLENAERLDLSWIERALFLADLTRAGFKGEVARSIVRVDAPQASRMTGVTDAVPGRILEAIGPAQGIGAPRWEAFAAYFKQDASSAEEKLAHRLEDPKFLQIPDAAARFQDLFGLLQKSASKPDGHAGSAAPVIKRSKGKLSIVAPAEHEAFAAWMESQVGVLWRKYLKSLEQPTESGQGSASKMDKE